MSDIAKGAVKFAAITAAVYFTGGAAAGALGWAKMGWSTAAMIGTIVSSAVAARGLKSQVDALDDGVIAKQAGIQHNPTGTEVTLPIIYGKAKIGISNVDVRQGIDANTLAIVGAIAIAPESGLGIEEVTDVYFGELRSLEDPVFGTNSSGNNPQPFNHAVVKSPWNGNVQSGSFGTDFWLEYFLHDGGDLQTYDYALNDQFGTAWPTSSVGKGVAYIVLSLYYNEDIYTNGVENITMEVKGNKVLDVQNLDADPLVARYSENPADCIYDYMTSARYGMGIPAAQIDTASFSAAAAYCDEEVTITLSSGTVTLDDRFTCNGFLMSDAGPLANLERLLSSCCGRIVMEGGKYNLLIRQAQSAETFELNRTNIVGDWSFARMGVSETPNTLVSTYIDKDLNYSPQPIAWPEPGEDNTYLTADNDYVVESRLELSFTEDLYMAEMITAQQFLEKRADMGCALVAQREALKLAVGDRVNVTHSTPSWDSQSMWVEAIGLRRDGLVQIAMKQYDASVYTVPTMTVKPDIVTASLPGRYSGADAPTVQVTIDYFYGEHQGSNVYWCVMNLSFSGGMGSYKVEHDPHLGATYDYTVTPFTSTSSNAYLMQSNGTTEYPFYPEQDPPTGRSTITITPYPEAALAGIAGPAVTATFEAEGEI